MILAECVAIVTLNLCTIIVFIRNRNLRKRSMYLVINLAVVDMVLGGVSAHGSFYVTGLFCNLWELNFKGLMAHAVATMLLSLVITATFTNVAIIALERVHATFFPLRHRVLKKWVYRLLIAVVWITSGLETICRTCIVIVSSDNIYYTLYIQVTFISICLLIICASYSSIVIKVRCGAQPQHHGAASRERKLTITLLIVTVVSLLLCLPHVISGYVVGVMLQSLSFSVYFHLGQAIAVLLFANSLVNPILYAMRMPEYRSALLALFCKRPQQQRQVAVFALRDM